MRLILLAGYRQTSESDAPWLDSIDGVPRLEHTIREAFSITPQVLVVLAGESADRALRECRSLAKCELVFDTHHQDVTLITNLKSALKLGCDPALVLPAELSLGDKDVLRRLVGVAVQQGIQAPAHLIQATDSKGVFIGSGFPLVLTMRGAQEIVKNQAIRKLDDPCLIRQVVATDLATRPVHL